MFSLAAAALTLLPIYPLNPIKQDTLNSVSMHMTASVTGPNTLVSASPGASLKCELLVIHPFVIRGAMEYGYGSILTRRYPRGSLHSITSALEVLLYRGTNDLSGYIGGGGFLTANLFALGKYSADSLLLYEKVEDVDISHAVGYRILFGLRFDKVYSVELSFSDTRPDYIYTERISPTLFSEYREQLRFTDVRLSIGYIVPISRF